ncbi:MAG: hypothetical protein H7832_14335 [Magnetococcus sp. DMHC-6]
MILLFNSGGDNKVAKIKNLLSHLLPLLKNAKTFPQDATRIVTESRFLFLYDADANGSDKIQKEFSQHFSQIDCESWINASVKKIANNPMAATFDTDKGIYVWGKNPTEGTLEDILMPLFQQSNKELMDKAEKAIDVMFEWKRQAEEKIEAVAETAKRFKAILTLAGQGKKPGSSMNVVIDQADLIQQQILSDSEAVTAFCLFIKNFAQLDETSNN